MISIKENIPGAVVADFKRHLATLPAFVPAQLAARLDDAERKDASFLDMQARLEAAKAAAVAEYHARTDRIAAGTASDDDLTQIGKETVAQIVARFVAPGEALAAAHQAFKIEVQPLLLEFYNLLVPVIDREIDAILQKIKAVYDGLGVPFHAEAEPITHAIGCWRPILKGWFVSESIYPPGPGVVRHVLGNFRSLPAVAPGIISPIAAEPATPLRTAAFLASAK